jgi:hypothetical protein
MAGAQKSALPMSATTYENEASSSNPASRNNCGICRITQGLVTMALMMVSSSAFPFAEIVGAERH